MTYNVLLLLDNKINEAQLDQVKRAVGSMYSKNTGIKIKWFEEWRDFSSYPKSQYWGGYEGLEHQYIRNVTNEIYSRYQEEIDSVVFFIHRDHWTLNGVWGWNMSAVYNSYGVQQCRFDNRNIVNSIGTLWHEMHHDVDSFVYVNTAVKVEPLVNVKNWDNDVTHGEHPDWSYIRHDENQKSLAMVPFKEAIAARRAIWEKKEGLYLQIIQLAQQVLVLQRQLIASRRGDLPIKINNICH